VGTDVGSNIASDHDVAEQLERAFTSGELTPYYQPQYDLATGAVVALEALCRWQHPELGLLRPHRFIPAAERLGLLPELSRFMLAESAARALDWHRRGARVGVAVNVSPREVSREFADSVLHRLEPLDLPHRTVTLEITESPGFVFSPDEITALEMLVDAGLGVSIDDFGAAHDSLDLLRQVPLTEVKIDKALVQGSSRSIDELVRACIDIARERGAVVVAEGIETFRHVERAVGWACDRGQGYYFSPPLPPDDLDPVLLGTPQMPSAQIP
jgi:EAL domain-containing protein (putative c-di-GMP-specific phosphodiesterase class I)